MCMDVGVIRKLHDHRKEPAAAIGTKGHERAANRKSESAKQEIAWGKHIN